MSKVKELYSFGEELGRGEFSRVRQCVHRNSGKRYAVKIIDKNDTENKRIRTEIEILKQVDHEHIIRLEEVYETDTKLYLIMELVTGGELFNSIVRLGSYTEGDAALLVRNIVSAVAYLHDLNIAHRDLKPTNLLLSTKDTLTDVKIADFGLSKILGDDAIMQTACGTPIYVAPEILNGDPYDKEVDMWSVGIIMYILLCGFPPFYDDGNNMGKLFEQIIEGEYSYPDEYWAHISEDAKDLIDHLLMVDPAQRFTAKQCLEHRWVKQAEMEQTAKILGVQTQLRKYMDKEKKRARRNSVG
mmetsp:Transcript_32581/g.81655  ORF Transcript_32581/g.81655 Transcript_32581/m.81655 type:complete len:300 (-) Transcript_32581:316-1215(-)